MQPNYLPPNTQRQAAGCTWLAGGAAHKLVQRQVGSGQPCQARLICMAAWQGRAPGSLPGLRSGTNGTPSASAMGGPKIKPRASKPVMQGSGRELVSMLVPPAALHQWPWCVAERQGRRSIMEAHAPSEWGVRLALFHVQTLACEAYWRAF